MINYKFYFSLQVCSFKLHITDFFDYNLLNLMTVLLDLCSALFLGDISTFHPLLIIGAVRFQGLLLALVADLPGLLLTVLGVAVLLGLLRASLHFKFADLLRLKVAILLLNWEGEDVGELLTVPVDICFAHLHLDLEQDQY